MVSAPNNLSPCRIKPMLDYLESRVHAGVPMHMGVHFVYVKYTGNAPEKSGLHLLEERICTISIDMSNDVP